MTILVDTGIFYAHFYKNAKRHTQAHRLFQEILDGHYGQPILLDYVFDEFVTLYQRKVTNKVATEYGNLILDYVNEDIFLFTTVSSTAFRKAWDIFSEQQGNKRKLSFTDCCIIKTAKTLDFTYIASFDGRFKSFHPTLPRK